MRIGLIARCEIARGIAIQSRNFYDHMPVERVLLVRMPTPDCEERPDWYEHRTEVLYNAKRHELDEATVRAWLEGLDVVFTVETPNDWRIPTWCSQMGVKLVIQGNPEFVRHHHPEGEHLPHPTQWWWPTRWRLDHLPAGRVMPVPQDRRPDVSAIDNYLRIVHVVGKRAWGDRNGTDLLIQAMPMVRAPVAVTIHTIDEGLPQITRRPQIEWALRTSTVEDRWSMYEAHHLLVLPRRYGGLCLPALEAAACGLVVMMPDCPPNEELAAIRVKGAFTRKLNMACGPVPCFDTDATQLAWQIEHLALSFANGDFDRLRMAQSDLLPTWEEWRPKYLDALEALL